MEFDASQFLEHYLWQHLHFTFFSVSLFFVSLLFLFIRKRSQKLLNLPPCPPGLPIIGNLHQIGNHPHRSLRSLSEKYGPLMLLHFGRVPTVIVSSPDIVKEIAKNYDVVFSDRFTSTASDVLYYGGNNIVFAPQGEYWKRARKLCVLELLSPKRVQSFQSVREEEVSSLVERLRKASVDGVSVNLTEMLISTSNNVISRCIFGRSLGGEEEEGRRVGEVVRRAMVQLMAFSVGDFFPSFGWIDVLRGFVGGLKSSVGDLDAFYNLLLEERNKAMNSTESSGVKDFVEILLQLQKGNVFDMELTHDHLKAIVQDMFFGGIETTSNISEWFMAEIMRRPSVLKKVQEEVRRVVGEKAKVEMNDIEKMDYFKCVVKETLRLHPPAPLLVPRKTTEDVDIGGYHIPAGTRGLINGWAIQRHPGSWDKPEEYIPKRFENNPVDFRGQDYFQFIPFGFGRRRCPGIKFGVVGVEYLIANLLYWFDWKLPAGEKEEDLDMSEVYGIVVHKKLPLHLVPIPFP
ncbi:Cytochrome P450 71A1 [Morus notabilis]|uniref:Cytochrome P450 71A1 n=1 Tax=Morus notabilis TaxID=981085 RepID=W9SCQ8_9ROSA|nr:cytochrome P450 71A1 [Morus notabilis]EXB99731.1 Cytochrome P450 71A1 [Morus notabilis]